MSSSLLRSPASSSEKPPSSSPAPSGGGSSSHRRGQARGGAPTRVVPTVLPAFSSPALDPKEAWIDCHAHLVNAQFTIQKGAQQGVKKNIELVLPVLESAYEHGVRHIHCVSRTLHETKQNLNLFRYVQQQAAASSLENLSLSTTIGTHPLYLRYMNDVEWSHIHDILTTHCNLITGIGECSIDIRMKDELSIEIQKAALLKQCELAVQFQKKLFICARVPENLEAIIDTIPIHPPAAEGEEKEEKEPPTFVCDVVLFSLCNDVTYQLLLTFLEHGGFICINGIVFYQNQSILNDLFHLFQRFPDRFILGSNSPFLAPGPWKRQYKTARNEPDSIRCTVDELSSVWNLPVSVLHDLLTVNSIRVLSLPSSYSSSELDDLFRSCVDRISEQ